MNRILLVLAFSVLLPAATLHAAITATFNGSGRLSVSTTDGESCIISLDNGFVKVNGIDPDSGPLLAEDMQTLNFNGDNASNLIDLSAITSAGFPDFTRATINAFGGDDTLLCSDFSNTIEMGSGSDTVTNFGAGFNLYDWTRGDGTESIVNDGTGTVRLRFQGSTGADNFILSSPAENTLQLTDNFTSQSVSIENITDLGLQLGDGDDIIEANDMSLVNFGNEIACNKNGGSLTYNGSESNQGVNFFLSDASTQISVTPGSGSDFIRNSAFSPTSFEYSITKSGEDVRLSYEFNSTEIVHLLRGFSTIFLSGTGNGDTYTLQDVGSPSLESIQIDGIDGSDTVNTVFQTSTKLIFSEASVRTGTDKLSVDAEGKLVTQTSTILEAGDGFGDIEFRNIETIEILNALAPPFDQWRLN